MKIGRLLGYGFLMWLLPFAVSLLIFPLRGSARPLFESLMAVVVAASAVGVGIGYLRPGKGQFLREGLALGLAGLLVNVGLDTLMFSGGPMRMGFAEYWMDIGLTYLMIPIITGGMGYPSKSEPREQGGSYGTAGQRPIQG